MSSIASVTTRVSRAGRSAALATIVAAGLLSGVSVVATTAFSPALAQKSPEAIFGRGSLADLVERVKPAVVSIQVRAGGEERVARGPAPKGAPPRGGQGGLTIPGLPEDHPLNEFFRNLPQSPEGNGGGGRPPRGATAQGSGFIISDDGLVVTNNHVIDGAGKITVQLDNDEKIEATLVGTDPRTDIALLRLKNDGRKYPFVRFATKEGRVGDGVLAIGNPFGLGGTVTSGIISALSRDINSGPYDYLQIDASVNRGNSGGPTFNLDGDVIGVNTAIYSPSGGSVGIAFAVPAKTVVAVIEQLKSTGTVNRGWLGVQIAPVDEDVAASVGLTEAKGAMVTVVTPSGPAESAGLRVQDTILAVNGQKINDSRDLARRIAEYPPNTTVEVRLIRNGKEQTIPVKLGLFPKSTDDIAKPEDNKPAPGATTELGALGLTLGQGSRTGVAIAEVNPNSDAANKGLRPGDIIVDVNGNKVTNAAEIEDQVRLARDAKRSAVLLNVKRGATTTIIPVRLTKG